MSQGDIALDLSGSFPMHPAIASLTARDRQKSDLTAKIETAMDSIENDMQSERHEQLNSDVDGGLLVAVAATQVMLQPSVQAS